MDSIVVYDTEYWSQKGAMQRHWGGLDDKAPLLIQIGAFKVELSKELTVVDDYLAYIIPRDETGDDIGITDFFTELTHISEAKLRDEGIELKEAISGFKSFCGEDRIYSYGSDMLATVVPSCFLNGVTCPFRPDQARDIRQVLRKTSLSDNEVAENTSGSIAEYLGIKLENHYAHDARNDALSIIAALRFLVGKGELDLEWL